MMLSSNLSSEQGTIETDKEKINLCIQNYEKMCKFCCKLRIGEMKMKQIYDESTEVTRFSSMKLIEKITYTLNHDALIDDTEYKYINLICEDCESKIDEFYEFKRMCERNTTLLFHVRDVLEKMNIEKFEDIEIENSLSNNVPNEVTKHDIKDDSVTKSTVNGTVCQICGKLVKGIQMHMLIHKGIKKFQCQYCQKSFTQSGQLKRHINGHLDIRNYSCPQPGCGRTFVDPSSVTKHLVVHNKEDRKFVCSLCDKRFNRLGALRYHEKTHRQERNHKCTVCDKSFLAKYDLTKHFRIHTGEKPYSCHICNKKFSISKNAKVHLKVHSKEKPFSCHLCQLVFSYRSSLKQHLLKIHKYSPKDNVKEGSTNVQHVGDTHQDDKFLDRPS